MSYPPSTSLLPQLRGQSARGPALWNQKGLPASKAFNTLLDDSLSCTLSAGLYYYYIRLYYIRLHYIIYYISKRTTTTLYYILYIYPDEEKCSHLIIVVISHVNLDIAWHVHFVWLHIILMRFRYQVEFVSASVTLSLRPFHKTNNSILYSY